MNGSSHRTWDVGSGADMPTLAERAEVGPGVFTIRDHDQANTNREDPGMEDDTMTVTAALFGLAGFEVLAGAPG